MDERQNNKEKSNYKRSECIRRSSNEKFDSKENEDKHNLFDKFYNDIHTEDKRIINSDNESRHDLFDSSENVSPKIEESYISPSYSNQELMRRSNLYSGDKLNDEGIYR